MKAFKEHAQNGSGRRAGYSACSSNPGGGAALAGCAFLALALAVCIGVPARAQSPQERGKRVLDEAMKALGGDRFLQMRDRTEAGRVYSFYREELRGLARATIYTRYLTAPTAFEAGKVYSRERQSFGKDKEDYAILFDELKGYQITYRGANLLPEATLDRYRETTRRNIFYLLRQRLREPGMLIESRGTDILDNQPTDVVEFTDAENNVVKVWFHYSTKLPVKQIFIRRDAKTKERHEEIAVFSKYRDVGGGVQWPFVIQRYRDGEKIFEIYSESVTINTDVPDNLFTLPANVKVLPPAK